MKSSLYNVYRKGESRYILFNTLTSAAAHIDEEMKRLLEENPDKIPEDTLEMFLKNGFVVEDRCDEKKILAHYFDVQKYNVFPYDLVYTVVMTYACNLACPYCYEGSEKDTETLNSEKVDILLKNIDKNLSKKDFKLFKIVLYGGEPLIAYNQCVQLMEGASKICNEQNKEFKGKILTNGVLITEEIVDTLLKPYCHWVQVTMDGGREAHNKRRIRKDGSGTYDTLLDVLELLEDADINLNLKLDIDRENADTFAELSRDLKERGIKNMRIGLGRIRPPDTEGADKGCASYAEKCFPSEEMPDFAHKVYEQMDQTEISRKSPEIPKYSPCMFGREDIYLVDPYLELYNCWGFVGQEDKKVGYIDESGEMIFNFEYYEQMSRNPLEFEECKDCKYLPICAGGCAGHACYENGTYHSSLCRRCNYFQKSMSQNIDSVLKEMELSIPNTGN